MKSNDSYDKPDGKQSGYHSLKRFPTHRALSFTFQFERDKTAPPDKTARCDQAQAWQYLKKIVAKESAARSQPGIRCGKPD
jgi:hypothetical protein